MNNVKNAFKSIFYKCNWYNGVSKSIYHKSFSKAINVMNRNKMPKANVIQKFVTIT